MQLENDAESELSQELIESYQDYLKKIAYFVKISLPDTIELEDLVQYGQIGLIEASRKFDPKIGVSFKTYSYYRIKGAIYDGLRTMGIFKNKQYKQHLLQQKINDLMLQENNCVNTDESDVKTEQKLERLKDVFSNVATMITLSYASYMDFEIQEENTDILETLISDESKLIIKKAVEQLSAKEKEVVNKYYFQEMTFEEIGKQLNLSKSWISRVHLSAIKKLKQKLRQSNMAT